ncbi:MAG: AAA family ATPase [Deltaproteobacteria bacterium]|nr:AAA family ATPase [Deltaproteobacteria bacterium]
MSERPAVLHLEQVLQDCKLVVAVGSGGVGKTTTAAALAIAAARRGRRCAVLTIDPARRLAQALGVSRLGNEPQALDTALVAPGAVDAMMLEAPEALDLLIGRLVPDPARRERLYQNRLYQVIARHLGGTHEYMAVERLYSLVKEHDYDLVVLDTPPTVNALDFLDAPTRIAAFFSDKITRFFQRKHDENRGLIQRIRDRAGEVAIQVLGKALGEDFIEELIDFVTAFGGLFAAFQERGLVAEKLLRDASTAFVVVTGADPVRVAEAEQLAKTLGRLDLDARCFVANRVHQSPSADARVHITADDVAPALAGFASQVDLEALTAGLAHAQAVRASLARRDRAGLARLAELSGKKRLLVVPELDDEVGDRGAIDHLIDALFS